MRSIGLKEWVREIKHLTDGKPFLYADLPEHLRCMNHLLKSRSRGYIEKVGMDTKDESGKPRYIIWQLCDTKHSGFTSKTSTKVFNLHDVAGDDGQCVSIMTRIICYHRKGIARVQNGFRHVNNTLTVQFSLPVEVSQ